MILESQNLFSSNKIPPWHSLTAAQPESVFGDEEEDPAAEAQRELLKNKKQAGYVPHFDPWVAVTHDQKLCPFIACFVPTIQCKPSAAWCTSSNHLHSGNHQHRQLCWGEAGHRKKAQREWCVRFSIITLCRMMELSFVAPTCVDGSPNDIK